MGIRALPFFKGKKGWQFAGGGQADGGGGGGYTLPVATDSRLGGVKVGSGLEITNDGVLSASGGSGGGAQYSTTKFDTGKKWIDGRTIYGIVYNGRNYNDHTYPLPSGYNFAVNLSGMVSTTGYEYPINYHSGGSDSVRSRVESDGLHLSWSMGYDTMSVNMLLEYVETN